MTEQELKEIEMIAETMGTDAEKEMGDWPAMYCNDTAKLIAEIRRLQKEIEHTANTAAAIAKKNSEIAKQIADAPTIGGVETISMGESMIEWGTSIIPPIHGVNRSGLPAATHTARLVDIRKIFEE